MQSFWTRVNEHKVIQWGVAYLGAALALAHGAEIVSHALHWHEAVWRIFVIALIVGFPIAVTLAWYHGHRGLKRVSSGELAIVSVLVVIAAFFFIVAMRPPTEYPVVTNQSVVPTERPSPNENVAPSSVTPVSEQTIANSVAVLPFENLSVKVEDA